MGTELVRVRADPATDFDGSGLGRYLAAHLELERAASRRVAAVHLAALLAAPVWLCAEVRILRPALPAGLWLLGVALALALLSVCDELHQRRAALRAGRGVNLERRGTITP